MFSSEWVRPSNAKDAAAVRRLLAAHGLDPAFEPREFVVCESDGRVVGCARARSLPEGGTELMSVAVEPTFRGRGLARSMVQMVLLGSRHPVFALASDVGPLSRAGFEPVDARDLPPSLLAKAAKSDGPGGVKAMRLRRIEHRAPEAQGAPDFLDV